MNKTPIPGFNPPSEKTSSFNYEDERTLWDKFRDGDKNAFDTIFYKFIRLLYNYGSKITPDQGMVEDCIQELFIDLWEKRGRLSTTNSIKFYLFKSLRRRIERKINKEQRFLSKKELNEGYNFEIYFSHEEVLISGEISSEKHKVLTDVINSLTKRQKEIIFLKFYEQLSYEEISEIMSLSLNATYNLVSKTIDILRKLLPPSLFNMLLAIWVV